MTTGFVHADGIRLVDGAGRALQWRGIGLGNWLLPEGYMWLLPDGASSPRQIEALVRALVGDARAEEFWHGFREAFITEDDIARMAAEGFDHVRLAINSRVIVDADGAAVPDGLALIDRLIEWCRAYGLWVVLDLHGAPGGQTGSNIDDSLNGRPELFESAQHRERTIELWTMLARRYRDEPVVAGYDLLNEPIPNDYQHRYGPALAELYRDLTAAIRAVDPHHLIIYEGSHWATNWDIFDEVWDANSMLQFHKYWSPPDRPSIQGYLDTRAKLGLPIYMGEGGENSLDWLQTAFQLFEDHEIGWNFWPWKKIETQTSPCSIDAPLGWEAIVDWARAAGPQPDPDDAWSTLTALLDAMTLERCTYRPEVVDAMMRRVPAITSLRLPASGFGFRGAGVSFDTNGATPLPGFRDDDAVTIRTVDGGEASFGTVDGGRYNGDSLAVVLNSGDWVAYDVTVTSPAVVEVDVTTGPATITVEIAGQPVPLTATPSGWRGRTPQPVPPGTHEVRLTASADDVAVTSLLVGALQS